MLIILGLDSPREVVDKINENIRQLPSIVNNEMVFK